MFVNNCIVVLKKMKTRKERDQVIWEGFTPFGGIAYCITLPCLCYAAVGCPMEWIFFSRAATNEVVLRASSDEDFWECLRFKVCGWVLFAIESCVGTLIFQKIR